MTRRRQSRRRHRTERRERDPSAPALATVQAPPDQDEARGPWLTDVSWTGLLGGITGTLALGQAAVYILVENAQDVSTLWVIPILAAAAVYLPAVWVSLRPNPGRRPVYRAILAVTLVFMVFGAVFLDPAFFGLLLIPSSLLAVAAGMLFSKPTKGA